MANKELPPFSLHAKETVTIIRPMPSVIPRGSSSPRDQQPSRSIRFEPEQLEAIDKAAEQLCMSRSAFIKWCAHYVAIDIIAQHDEFVRKFG